MDHHRPKGTIERVLYETVMGRVAMGRVAFRESGVMLKVVPAFGNANEIIDAVIIF